MVVAAWLVNAGAGTQLIDQNTTGQFNVPGILSDTAFYIQRRAGSCQSALIMVNVRVVDASYFAIPTAFTPNGDGKNDYLRVHVIGLIKLKSFRLFNRYGQIVFQTSAIGAAWDGRIGGVLQDTGNFVWIAEGEDVSGNAIRDKGNVILVR